MRIDYQALWEQWEKPPLWTCPRCRAEFGSTRGLEWTFSAPICDGCFSTLDRNPKRNMRRVKPCQERKAA